jgi:phospholipase/carboxylesterase
MDSSPFALDGPRVPPRSGKARSLVVFLHGLGADGNDLISLAPMFAQDLPDAAFVSPHAPFPCDMAPYGRQWFSLQDRSGGLLAAGAAAAAPVLNAFLDAELDRLGLSDAELALVGFSQGTMMALHVAPRRAKPCAAVVGYSGMLIGPDAMIGVTARPPVLLVHGNADQIVPFEAMQIAFNTLKKNGFIVESLPCPGLAHGIDEAGIERGRRFLRERLGPNAAGPYKSSN